MKSNDIIRLSIFIITEYYKNNLHPFFDHLSDDIVWIGPARGQYIQGKKKLIQTFAMEKHSLTFTMGDIRARYMPLNNHIKEVVLHYDVCTHYPDGNTTTHDQWLHYTWRDKKVREAQKAEYQPEIVCLHISNAWPYDERDVIYPVHYESISPMVPLLSKPEHYVTVKTTDRCIHRIAASHILYAETVKHSAKLRIHTESETITVNDTLSAFEKKYPELFLRIHSGYLLNPAHVTDIRRFAVALSDGTELPIPEKKYTRVKKQILRETAEDKP